MVLGKQGAGKGTQAERLAQHFGVPRISTGDMLRVAVRAETDVGLRAKQAMDSGELIPDDVVIGVVRDRLSQEDADTRGFILEGFPRTVGQAEALDEILSPRRIDLVISLDVPTGVVLRRLASRRVCEECGTNYGTDHPPTKDWTCDLCGGRVIQRDDDTEAAITRRLALYEEQTAPPISWYLATDRLAAVDGVGSPDVVTGRLLRAIDNRLARR